jgi:hypothetical protein
MKDYKYFKFHLNINSFVIFEKKNLVWKCIYSTSSFYEDFSLTDFQIKTMVSDQRGDKYLTDKEFEQLMIGLL